MTYNPRRNRLDLMHPAEKAIQDAIWEIEKLPADVELTRAQVLLSQGKDYKTFKLKNMTKTNNGTLTDFTGITNNRDEYAGKVIKKRIAFQPGLSNERLAKICGIDIEEVKEAREWAKTPAGIRYYMTNEEWKSDGQYITVTGNVLGKMHYFGDGYAAAMAVNNTFHKGINPESVWKLKEYAELHEHFVYNNYFMFNGEKIVGPDAVVKLQELRKEALTASKL